ncbi:MAG: hypothetical protein Q9162_000620 [Coniocarpon cinnabarinum]
MGRPPPLSTITVGLSDLYMRRTYSRIQQRTLPDTIIFLGDLFDGGREWATESSQSLDERWQRIGQKYWRREFNRFSGIFLQDWKQTFQKRTAADDDNENTRIIASLPGNHDLGFGEMIQIPVRERFNAFFGDSNRVDFIGNHTFVSVDTVSLSAIDDDRSNPAIWRPAYDFLRNVTNLKAAQIEKHLHYDGNPASLEQAKFSHTVEEPESRVVEAPGRPTSVSVTEDIPTILLTHVPLDRPPGKPCGPLRERWPPTALWSGLSQPIDYDERNALPSLGFGWQYKNALSARVSKLIVNSLEGTISHAFSGDDHDFCEVIHRSYPSPGAGIREITVKSLSWTMGVRRPGFLLVSLWNELKSDGQQSAKTQSKNHESLQTHLCLLPDQIRIYMLYGLLLGISMVSLALQTTYQIYLSENDLPGLQDENVKPVLPISNSETSSMVREKFEQDSSTSFQPPIDSLASSSSSDDGLMAHVSARNPTSFRERSVSPVPPYGYHAQSATALPLVSYATNRAGWDDPDLRKLPRNSNSLKRRRKPRHQPLFVPFITLVFGGAETFYSGICALLAILRVVSAQLNCGSCTQVGGNCYCEKQSAIQYNDFGAGGTYHDVTNIQSCAKTPFNYPKAPSAPLNEEVTVVVRGPVRLKQFAAYAPLANPKSKRNPVHGHGHQHAHIHEEQKRAMQVMSFTSNGKVIDFTADPATWYVGAAAPTTVSAPAPAQQHKALPQQPPQQPPKSAPQPAKGPSEPPASEPAASAEPGDWAQLGSYNAAGPSASGIVFLKSNYAPLTYMAANGKTTQSSETTLQDVLIPSNEEFTIWTNKKCAGGNDCGYYDPSVAAYHGFGGSSKAFVFEFSMPTDEQNANELPCSSNLNPNMPAIWLLNSKVPRVAQYGCNCHPQCGEFDLFEVLNNTQAEGKNSANMMKSTFYSAEQSLGSSDWFPRPMDKPVKGAVVMCDYAATIALLPDDFEIGPTLTSSQISSIVSNVPGSAKTVLPNGKR